MDFETIAVIPNFPKVHRNAISVSNNCGIFADCHELALISGIWLKYAGEISL
jgi:hypothetical protein